jgi:LysM repeat protein
MMRKIHVLVFGLMGVLGLALIGFGLLFSYPIANENVEAAVASAAPAIAAADLNTRDAMMAWDDELTAADLSDTDFVAMSADIHRDDMMLSDEASLAMDAAISPAAPPPSELQNTAASPLEWRHKVSRFFVHIIRRGETLSGIAERFDTSVFRLRRLNHICNPNRIFAGRRLLIPRFD